MWFAKGQVKPIVKGFVMLDARKKAAVVGWRTCAVGCLAGFLVASAALAQPAPAKLGALPRLPSVNGESVPVVQTAQANEPPPNAQVSPPAPALPYSSEFNFSIGETVFLSIFSKHAPKRQWTPLYADTFFTDGWFDPHIAPPETTGGSVRQGWAGLNDVFFNRMVDFTFSGYRGANGKPNQQVGALDIETPISRRLMLGIIVPYVDALNGNGQPSASSVGDSILESRFILHETRDLTITINLNLRVPTGSTVTGNHQTSFNPYVGWYKDLGYNGWSFRGLVGIADPLSGASSERATGFYQTLALGQTLTPHDVRWFGDFTYYLCVNASEAQNTYSFVSLTPGIRTHLGRNWFFLAGLEIPVTANAGFSERLNFQLVKGF
jgi:hypothetical protein